MRFGGNDGDPWPASCRLGLLTTAEVAAIFRRTDRTIRRWAAMGRLLPVRIGGSVYFRAEDINALISRQISDAILLGRNAREETM